MKKMMMGVSALALMASAANAQMQDTTVTSEVVPAGERMAADHAPLGVRAGSFLVIPKVELVETYNDNIYASESNEESDLITSINPEVAVRSNWNRHAVNAVAKANIQRYADNGDEDQENYQVAADGRLDVLRDTSIGGGVSYAQDHEERGDPNTIGAPDEPVEYTTTVARIGAFRGLGRANARIDSEIKNIEFEDGTSTGGAAITNSVRDRNEYTQTVRLGYQLTDTFEGFVRGQFDNRVYENKAVARSNNGQSYVAGTTFDISGKTKGEVYGGWMNRNYSDSGREGIDDVTYGGKVTWNATDLTSVIGSLDRGIAETTIAGSSGFVNTNYNLGVEHALTRDVLLKGKVGYTTNEYEGTSAFQRDDEIITAGIGADYYLNRCFKAGLSYNYTDRDSNVAGGDFGRNTVMLRLTATY